VGPQDSDLETIEEAKANQLALDDLIRAAEKMRDVKRREIRTGGVQDKAIEKDNSHKQ